jgi:vacuolar-type H+-ATPase subunit E/Vma4
VGIEALCSWIEHAGQRRAQEQLYEAHVEAARLRHAAKRAAARRLAQSIRGEDQELRRAAQKAIATARRDARRRVLRARGEVVERIFAEAREILPEVIASRGYRASLAGQLRHALAYVPGPARVRGVPALARSLEAALPERGDVQLELDPELPPGFTVCSGDGRVVVDATLTTRLAVEGPRLAAELVARLDEDS